MQGESPSLQAIRDTVTPEQQALLDEIWLHFVTKKEWPPTWGIHRPHRKELFRKSFRPLGGGVVREMDDGQHGSRYGLTLVGVLVASEGPRIEKLLLAYLEFLRRRYQSNPMDTTIKSSDVQSELGLASEETVLLGRMVEFGSLFSRSAGFGEDWSAGILRDVEDFPPQGDLIGELEKLAFRWFKLGEPVFLDDKRAGYQPAVVDEGRPASIRSDTVVDPLKRRYQVFLSSTYDDLEEERKHVMQALLETFCIPTGMEMFPATSEEQMKLIQRVIGDCDYYIVIVAGRYGSIGSSGVSYTEMEFDYALSIGKPVIAFFHDNIKSLPGTKLEEGDKARELLAGFTNKLKAARVCKAWNSVEGLASAIKSAILHAIMHDPKPGWVRATDLATPSALAELERVSERNQDLGKPDHTGTKILPRPQAAPDHANEPSVESKSTAVKWMDFDPEFLGDFQTLQKRAQSLMVRALEKRRGSIELPPESELSSLEVSDLVEIAKASGTPYPSLTTMMLCYPLGTVPARHESIWKKNNSKKQFATLSLGLAKFESSL